MLGNDLGVPCSFPSTWHVCLGGRCPVWPGDWTLPCCPPSLQVRDDNKRQHPCLVEFSQLPEQERNYNLQMSLETLK